MSVVADISVGATDFILGQMLTSNPDISIHLERVVPLGGELVPYVWASNESIEDLERAFGQASSVNEFEIVDTVDDRALVRLVLSPPSDGLLVAITETDAVLLDAVGTGESWRFQLRFPHHEHLSMFDEYCRDRGIDLHVESVHSTGTAEDLAPSRLTATQRDTLRRALAAGYFEVPRRTNLVELADELDISDTALSQRLRRGLASLLEATVEDTES